MAQHRYAILIAPSANRVYSGAAPALVRGELEVLSAHLLEGRLHGISEVIWGGVPYLVVDADGLTGRDLRCLANLSSLHALFEVHGDLLRPVTVERLDRLDDDLLTILKYPGKTNEQFTRLLVNVTAAALGDADRFLAGGLRLLDPMCGRGTTLSQAMMYGWDAHGVDVDGRDIEVYGAFVRRWLRTKRLKHRAEDSRVRRHGENLGRRFTVTFAATKEEYRAGRVQTVEAVNADTRRAADVYPGGGFDLIVTDAPYGVQHGATGGAAGLARRPTELLGEAVPVWARLLRARGAMGISWNTQTTRREELEEIVRAAGLEPLSWPAGVSFEHRVDQAIDRDLMVARRRR